MPAKHKLNFTADETGAKVEKLSADAPKTKSGKKPKKSMKVKKNLQFEENKPKPSSKFRDTMKDTAKEMPGKTVSNIAHSKIEDSADDNVSVEAVNKGSVIAEDTGRTVRTYNRRRHRNVSDESTKKTREERAARRNERRIGRENINERYERKQAEIKANNPEAKSNPYSKWRQKQEIKKEYYAAKAGKSSAASTASSSVSSSAKKAVKDTGEKVTEFVASHKIGVAIALGVVLAIVVGIGALSSGMVLVQSGTGGIALSTYPSEDSDMEAAEKQYCQLEANLQKQIDNYESTHSYDEYHYTLDEIGHDPYVLMSLLTAKHEGEFTADEVRSEVSSYFSQQYTLSQRVVREVRYRTEYRSRLVTVYAADGTTSQHIEYYTVQVPYNYYICYVTLKNNNLSHIPSTVLTEDQLSLYSIYMSTLGNREDLFPDSEYIGRYDGEAEHYDIPATYLSNETFSKMMAEADKYVGMPYVFGGSSPSTSFDCSGYVSWVINHSGWNVGRLTAQGLCNICTPVSKASAKPGDLIFFSGTYDSGTAVSHVGIVVDPANFIMVDAGDPIKYESYNTSYWNSHFYCIGRLPAQ